MCKLFVLYENVVCVTVCMFKMFVSCESVQSHTVNGAKYVSGDLAGWNDV